MLPGGQAPPSTPVQVISGGMAGWQITLIALGAALVAAALAVQLDRTLAARRRAQRRAPHWPTQGLGTESGSSQDSDSAKQDLIDFG
jgi:lipopolysaccharide export LptBFGC system permease protein LptF